MVEKDMYPLMKKYVQAHLPETTEVYELKICKGTSLPFNALAPHQEEALLKAYQGGFYYRIADIPWGRDSSFRFTPPKPFDSIAIVRVQSFVVVWFYHPGQKKVFIKIPIETFIKERETSTRKSLTEDRAKEIGEQMFI